MKSTVVTLSVGTFFGPEICALIQTTLPAGAVKPFHETGAPAIAVPLGGITQAGGVEGQLSVAGPVVTALMLKSPFPSLVLTVELLLVSVAEPVTGEPPSQVTVRL